MATDTLRKEQRDAHTKGMQILTKADDEKRDLTEAEQSEARDHFNKARSIGERIKLAEEGAAILEQIGDPAPEGLSEDEKSELARKTGEQIGDQFKLHSAADQFVDSEQIKALAKRYPNGVPDKAALSLDSVTIRGSVKAIVKASRTKSLVDDLLQVNDNATAGTATLPTAVRPDWVGIYAPRFTPLTFLDAISRVPTSSNLVQWVREVDADRSLNAAVVKEAAKTDSSDDDGTEVKPQSAFGFEMAEDTVKLIAAWMAVTNTALSDIPQLRALIDLFLGRDLQAEAESQALNGSGSGLNMTGVLNTSGVPTQSADVDIFSTTRKALTTLHSNAAIPDGWVMAPADIETVELQQDNNGRYYGNGPFALGPRTLWGLPIIENFSIASGTVLGGELSSIVFYDREELNLSVGTVDDDFIRNIRRILAEMRGVVVVPRPKNLVKITLPS